MGPRSLTWIVRQKLMAWLSPHRLPEARAAWLRKHGARIGEGCLLYSDVVLSEPCLLDIGDRVSVGWGTYFVTHDGSPELRTGKVIFGRISVGTGSFIGSNCVILPGTTIGRDCIVGAGSVVRGTIPDGSVVIGNPASVVMTTAMADRLSARSRNGIAVQGLSAEERDRAVRAHFGLG